MDSFASQLRKFPTFVLGVITGLVRAALTEPEVFLLAVMGWLLGSRSARQRGFGMAIAGWIIARQADKYVMTTNSNLSALVRVIGDNPQLIRVTADD